MSSARSRLRTTSARSSGAAGASVKPQLPITTLVTPCQHVGLPRSSQNTWASMCVCASTKPGATTSPSASSSSRPRPSTSPTATMRSPTTATSPRTPGRARSVDHQPAAHDQVELACRGESDVHDPTASAALDEVAADFLDQQERRAQVDGVHEVPVLLVDAEEVRSPHRRADATRRCVVDEDVDRPQRVDDRLHRRCDRGVIGQIHPNEQGLRALGLELLDRLASRSFVATEDRHRRTVPSEELGGRAPDARRASGDDGRLARELVGRRHRCVHAPTVPSN